MSIIFTDIRTYIKKINEENKIDFSTKFKTEDGKISTDNDYQKIAEYLIYKYKIIEKITSQGYKLAICYDEINDKYHYLKSRELDSIIMAEIYNTRRAFRNEMKIYIKILVQDLIRTQK